MLCQVAYWDNTVTTLSYDTDGHLVRFTHPGDVVYDLAYYIDTQTGSGLLKSVRDPLTADTVAAGLRTNDATVLTEIMYYADGDPNEGKVASVTQPAPAAGALRPKRSYTYSAGEGKVSVAGFNPSIGFAERVRYDGRNRVTERTDAAGLTTTYTWDTKDHQTATTDPAGLRTTTHYDQQGRAIAKYGPAPASSFDSAGFPVAGATVPLSSTDYDGDIVGLAASYWNNPNLAGPPKLLGTGLGVNGAMDRDWGTSLPVTPGAGGWSARFSGLVDVSVAGSYRFSIGARGQQARLWVDDALLINHTSTDETNWYFTSMGSGVSLAAGSHTLRVEMIDTSGPAGLKVQWYRDSMPGEVIPGIALSPNYGLVTTINRPRRQGRQNRIQRRHGRHRAGVSTADRHCG